MEELKESFLQGIEEFNDLYEKVYYKFLVDTKKPTDEDVKEAVLRLTDIRSSIIGAIDSIIQLNDDNRVKGGSKIKKDSMYTNKREEVVLLDERIFINFNSDYILREFLKRLHLFSSIILSIATIERDRKLIISNKEFEDGYILLSNLLTEENKKENEFKCEEFIIYLKHLYDKNKLNIFLESNFLAYDKEITKRLVPTLQSSVGSKYNDLDIRELESVTVRNICEFVIEIMGGCIFDIDTNDIEGSSTVKFKMINLAKLLINNTNYFNYIEVRNNKVVAEGLDKMLNIRKVFNDMLFISETLFHLTSSENVNVEKHMNEKIKQEKAINFFNKEQLEKVLKMLSSDFKESVMEITIGDLIKMITSFSKLIRDIIN